MESKVTQLSRDWLGAIASVIIALAALAGVVRMQSDAQFGGLSAGNEPLGRSTLTAAQAKQAEQQEVVRLQLLKAIPTFGFDNLIADWTFLKYLQYFGDDEVREQTGYSLNTAYFDAITKRDPRWVDIYPFLSTGISFYLGKPEITVQLMDRGTTALSPKIDPRAWQVWRFKGLDQLLLLGDIPGSIQSHEMAAFWAEETPYRPIAPALRETAEFLRTDPNSKTVRFLAWSSVYYESQDKLVRQRATQELLKLGAKIQRSETGELRFLLPSNPGKE